MKRQQWLFFKVFSKTLTPQLNSYNNVRRPFCSAATTNMSFTRLLEKKLPLLIVPYNHQGEDGDAVSKKERRLCGSVCDDTLGFISPFHADDDDDDQLELVKNEKKKQEVYKVYLPEIADRRICGSSEGWLVTVHENSEVQLLNPISRVVVNLPPLITRFPRIVGKFDLKDKGGLCYLYLEREDLYEPSLTAYVSDYFRETFLRKVVTNTNTRDANSTLPTVVMAIYRNGKLAFCRPSPYGNGVDGDDQNKWICCPVGNQYYGYEDVTFYKGNFYAVGCFGGFGGFGSVGVVKGLDGPSPFLETVINEPILKIISYKNYLVESSSSLGGGDLLMVMKHAVDKCEKECPYRTRFKVLKLDFNGPSWVEVTNLGEDCALFIGYNHSFSFSVSKFPGTGCRGNCIYFTNNEIEPFYKFGEHVDMGVYNLEDGSIEKLNYENGSQLIMPPLIWYVPN